MMGWVSLHRAAQLAGVDRKNARVKLSNLKKKHPKIHKKLVRKRGSNNELKEPETVVFLQTDFRKGKIIPFFENLFSKSNNLKRISKKIIFKANELQSRSESGELGFDINEIIRQTSDQMANRLAITINICFDYSMGIESLEECANKYKLNRFKFYRWCFKFPQVQTIRDLAYQIRKQYLNKRDVEESEENLRKIAKGGKIKTQVIDCEISYDKNGKMIFRPIKYRITTKSHLPDKEANIFILTNKDPQNWKRTIPFEFPLKASNAEMDQLQNKSLEELSEIIDEKQKLLDNKNLDENESTETSDD